MAKLTLNDLNSLQNETSAINTINNNNDAIEAAFENTLSRDGTSPNTMESDIDMNGFRITNLPEPGSDTEPVRRVDVLSSVTDAEDAAEIAQQAAQAAVAAKEVVEDTIVNLGDFNSRYLGAASSNPSVDLNGNPVTTGALYFNTAEGELRVYSGSSWAPVLPGDSVNSVFGRTGAVTAQTGDYTATQITFSATGSISSTNVQAAIAELDTEKAATGHNHDSDYAAIGHNHSGVYEPVDADILRADTSDNLEAGFTASVVNAGTKSSGTFTPDPTQGNFQSAVNGGAHTLAPPSSNCSMIIQYTNNSSAGAITTSGFTKVTGDSFTTTNGDDFMCYIAKVGTFSHLHITALQ